MNVKIFKIDRREEGERWTGAKGGRAMIQVCYYKDCGIIYGEKEPLSDKAFTHGLCPKHLEICLQEMKAELEGLMGSTEKLKVLIVEDNNLFRVLLQEYLSDRFPSVDFYEAIDGKEALEKVEVLLPNMIFMDIRLPGEDGIVLTQKIKARHPKIMVIVLTGYDLPEYREASIQYADYFFSKDTTNPENIFSVVKSILPRHGSSGRLSCPNL